MSMKKFVYRRNCSDDEDSDSLFSKCFAISPGVQMKEIPTNGEEYLLKVIKERQKISAVTTCKQDYTKFAKKQTCFVKEEPSATVPEELKPTIEWQNIQVADFSDVRLYINRLQSKKSSWPVNIKKIKIRYTEAEEWEDFFSNSEPTLSCVLGLPFAALDYGLEYLTEVIGATQPGQTIDHKTGQWTYAFLACTRQPLLSDSISILRNLARKCAEVRANEVAGTACYGIKLLGISKNDVIDCEMLVSEAKYIRSALKMTENSNRSRINPENEDARTAVAPLNIFICLVARYFRQYDLAD